MEWWEWWEWLLIILVGIFIFSLCGAIGWLAFFRLPSMLIYNELLPRTIKVVEKKMGKYPTDEEIKKLRDANERIIRNKNRDKFYDIINNNEDFLYRHNRYFTDEEIKKYLSDKEAIEAYKENCKRIFDDELAQGKITESEYQQELDEVKANAKEYEDEALARLKL